MPPEYCSEFLKLLNESRPFSYAIVRDLVRRELGQYPEELFAAFEACPLAVASIAQVHKAVSFDGMPLAVKIQRPSVRAQFAADFINQNTRVWNGFATWGHPIDENGAQPSQMVPVPLA